MERIDQRLVVEFGKQLALGPSGLDEAVDTRRQHGLLGGEVLVQRTRAEGQASRLLYLSDRGPVVTPLGEEPHCRIEEAFGSRGEVAFGHGDAQCPRQQRLWNRSTARGQSSSQLSSAMEPP